MNNTTYVTKEHFRESDKIVYKYYFSRLVFFYELFMALFLFILLYIERYIMSTIFMGFIILFPVLIRIICDKKSIENIKLIFEKDDSFFTYDYHFTNEETVIKVFVKGHYKEYKFKNNEITRIIEKETQIFILVNKSTCFVCDIKGFDAFDRKMFRNYFSNAKKYEVKL